MLKDVLLRCFVECFYNKDGKWYYARTYTALRLADLTPKEFEQLSTEVLMPVHLSTFFYIDCDPHSTSRAYTDM